MIYIDSAKELINFVNFEGTFSENTLGEEFYFENKSFSLNVIAPNHLLYLNEAVESISFATDSNGDVHVDFQDIL